MASAFQLAEREQQQVCFGQEAHGGVRIWDVGREQRGPEEIAALVECHVQLELRDGQTRVRSGGDDAERCASAPKH